MGQSAFTQDTLILRAHAKVNLALSVERSAQLGGLHRICSWMHGIELCDEIEMDRVPQQQESNYVIGWKQPTGKDTPVGWDQDSDLSVRAHKLVEAHVGKELKVSIRISKSIPAGGGLGGGSSDAASVLMGLNRLFNLGLDQAALVGLAMKLGSDVPFFLDSDRRVPRPAIVQGIGDEITRLDLTHVGTPISLILPEFGCETGQVYRVFDELVSPSHMFGHDEVCALAGQRVIDVQGIFNDLASPACVVEAELGELQARVERKIGQPVHISGSGSTLFVIGLIEPDQIAQACPECLAMQTRLC